MTEMVEPETNVDTLFWFAFGWTFMKWQEDADNENTEPKWNIGLWSIVAKMLWSAQRVVMQQVAEH